MTEELIALLARLAEPGDNPLTDEELATLAEGCRDRAAELSSEPRTDEVVAELQQLAQTVGQIRTEQNTRAEAQAQRDADAQAALDAIADADEQSDEDEGDGGADDGQSDADESSDESADDAGGEDATVIELPTATGDAPAAGDQAPSAVAASARPAARAPHDPRRRRPSAPATPRATATLLAAGDMPGFSSGQEVPTIEALSDSMARKLRAMGPNGGSVLVASMQTDFPEERMLHASDTRGNEEKYQAAVSPAALTAAGGICGPLAVDYSVPTFASAERPVRDGLVRFGAERGGITFVTPPKIGDVAGATGIWTEATDASPGGATKAVLTVACGSTQNVEVDAITTILRFGNMQGRFNPEQVAANTQNAVAAAARIADVNLLNKIHAASTEVTFGPTVGAGRGVLETLDQVIAAIRYRMRLSDQARFRWIPPRWLKDMIRTDYARELPSGTDRLGMSDAEIDAYFSARGFNTSWHLDGVAASATTGRTYPDQLFAAQSAGALNQYPAKVVFPVFPEGSFQFLDGGELNLGVVRDSTLNSTNDYETFIETFENVAFRGVEALWVIATVAPTGASAGTVTPAFP